MIFQLLKQQKRRDQIKTLELVQIGVEINKEKIHVDAMFLFLRLLALIEREEEIREYFWFELTAFPTSLYKNGMMRKANKSKLAKSLKKNVFSNSYQVDQSFNVLDGGALLHKVKWLPNTSYQYILNQYSRYVKSRYDRACIVFDGYDNGPYTKDHEHQRRAGKMAGHITLEDLQMIPTCSQEMFSKSDRNKVQLISILSEELRRDSYDVWNSTGDADTQIVSAALEYAGDIDNDIVVVASDTDILVLLIFTGKKEWIFTCSPRLQTKKMWIASFGR